MRCFTCFRLVLKSKGNARLFSNFACPPFFKFCLAKEMHAFLKICLTDGYADATYVGLVLKSKGNAHHFVLNLCLANKQLAFLKICLTDGYADATHVRLVLKSKGNAYILFLNLFLASGWMGYGRRGSLCDPQLVFCSGRRDIFSRVLLFFASILLFASDKYIIELFIFTVSHAFA